MQSTKENVAPVSIAASAGLTVAKTIVGLLTGSLAILSEAAHSLIDVFATVMTYLAVRISGKPADEEHHYGHGKIESLTALAETALLFVLSGVVVWEAAKRLTGTEAAVQATLAAFVVMGASIAVDFWRSRALYRVADATKSEALEADALHFSSDLWSSAAVVIGLAGVALGFQWADAAAALIVAIVVCVAGWRLGRRTIDTLTDTAPPGIAAQVTALASFVPGVVAVEGVRARQVGQDTFVELTVAVSRTLPIDRVTAIKGEVAAAIRSKLEQAQVSVTTESRALSDESVLERVNVIARNRALAVHHVTVHDLGGGKLSVSLDLEVDGKLALRAAHDIADGLEAAIGQEIGPGVEVETHIEPLQTVDLSGRDAPAGRVDEVAAALADLANKVGAIREIHDVRVRETSDGEIVNFHCRIEPSRSVHEVHARVDDLERALRGRWPSIKRVIGHAEPLPR
jgi:cation diffusion facilitator family transporter